MTPSTPNTADLGELVAWLNAAYGTMTHIGRVTMDFRSDFENFRKAADLLTAQQREIEDWRKCYSDRIEAERATIRAEVEAEVAELKAQLKGRES